jgi:hypothetical protein
MAQYTNTFSSYDAVGNREDLSDIIYNIDPFDTPIMSSIGRRNLTNRVFDWQTEQLPALALNNARPEGDEVLGVAGLSPQTAGNASITGADANVATVRLSNATQISYRTATVSGTQEVVDGAGRGSEMAHQMALKSKALKRDIEATLSQNQEQNNGSDSTPRKSRALEHWIQTNKDTGPSYSFVDPVTALTDGNNANRDLTEARVKDVLQLAFTNGGEPSLMVVGPFNKRVVSNFRGRNSSGSTPVAQITANVGKNTVVQSVSVYETDFGSLKVIPSRWVRERTVLLLDPEYARIGFLRNFTSQTLAKTGDHDARMILAEWGLQVDNERAHAKIADITTSGTHG